jgi:hypothetical protein
MHRSKYHLLRPQRRERLKIWPVDNKVAPLSCSINIATNPVKIAQFIVNRVPDCQYGAARYLRCRKLDDVVPQSAKASAAMY